MTWALATSISLDWRCGSDSAFRADDGTPMYEGQALVQSSCGQGSFCHLQGAVGAERFGVPKDSITMLRLRAKKRAAIPMRRVAIFSVPVCDSVALAWLNHNAERVYKDQSWSGR
ncbi:MAG: hypothetical protein R3A47_02930 [Polyangiales bacterium]